MTMRTPVQLPRLACTLLLVCLAITPVATAQDSDQAERPRTLSERFSSLGFGWGRKSADEAPEAAATRPSRREASASSPRVASANTGRVSTGRNTLAAGSETQSESRTTAGSIRSRLPSLDPRDLLPEDFLSRRNQRPSSEESQDGRSANRSARPGRHSPHVVGSARARMMRDLRQNPPTATRDAASAVASQKPTAERTPQPPVRRTASPRIANAKPAPEANKPPRAKQSPTPLARRAPARAGSVLSSDMRPAAQANTQRSNGAELTAAELRRELLGSKVAAKPKTAASSPAKREVNKSLAAEIAREMATAVEPSTTAEATADLEETSVASSKSAAAATAKQQSPATTNTELGAAPATQSAVGSRYAASETMSPTVADATDEGDTDTTVGVNTIRTQRSAPASTQDSTTQDLLADKQTRSRGKSEETPVLKFDGVTREGTVSVAPVKSFARGGTAPSTEEDSAAATSSDAELLVMGKMPQIASRVDGPRRIVIGREAGYKVILANRGEAAAQEMVARVRVPEWADVVGVEATKGHVTRSRTGGDRKTLLWRLDRFDAQSLAQLDVTLIARKGQPIELGVDWNHAPVVSRAMVEVQEPKLNLTVTGPEEVLFGAPQRYELKLSNPGTGAAEDVAIFLAPPGKTADQATRHNIGSIDAGRSKTVEIELTAREAGELAFLARATASGGIEAAAEKKLFCRKPALEVDWRGPAKKYSGALATYFFRIRNPGTAPAEDVTFAVDLPRGFELQATSPGQKYDPARRRLAWKVGSLRPGDDHYLQIRGIAKAAGANEFTIAAITADRLAVDKATASTEVIAVADLRLDVRDPKGPLPVGAEVVYEIRVKNRGAGGAGNVNIVAMFSEGIEPFAVEGGRYSMNDGRVAIDSIASMAPGAERVVKITARAERPGTHVFRAEVQCPELEIKLAEEEMTRFYADDPIGVGQPPRQARAMDDFVYPR